MKTPEEGSLEDRSPEHAASLAQGQARSRQDRGGKSVPTLSRLTRLFLRVGNTTFGGGFPTIALFYRELVDREGWITSDQYALAYSLSRITPGTTLLAFCAATGSQILGLRGAIAAVLSESVPSALLAVLLTEAYQTWGSNATVMAVTGAAAAAVAGMLWSAAWFLTRPHWSSPWKDFSRFIKVVLFAGGAFLASWKLGVTPVPILGLAAVAGFFWKEPTKS